MTKTTYGANAPSFEVNDDFKGDCDMSERDRRPMKAPAPWLTMAESRAWFETQAFMAASPMLRMLGRGDRQPVLVLPGFTGGDASTAPLRWFLRSQGFFTHGWHLGRNLGPTARTIDGIHERLTELYERHGRPVTIVGWSLGGIYARELARRHPEMVRQVITLGSPFRARLGDLSAASGLWDRLSPTFIDEFRWLLAAEEDKSPLTVPATAIYSRGDGIVAWPLCIERQTDRSESIEVRGSHCGLGVNPAALTVIVDRLSQPDAVWRPFKAPIGLRLWYPSARHFDDAKIHVAS
jgi:pimeloyl-ACP methyl ester carboxylesterase